MKSPAIRSRKYLAWVRDQDCCHCRAPGPSDPHHIRGVGHFGGMGMKAPDYLVMPLCRGCHDAVHSARIEAGEQWRMIVVTLDRAMRDGVIAIEGSR